MPDFSEIRIQTPGDAPTIRSASGGDLLPDAHKKSGNQTGKRGSRPNRKHIRRSVTALQI